MAGEAIFIGYRRDDTADVAGRIYDAMTQRFGKGRVFKDVDNIGPGVDFGDYIKSVLPKCRVALMLIGPHWLDSKDEDGRRRLDDEHDWVRVEIETALTTPGVLTVPVLVNGAAMPRVAEVPLSLAALLRRNAAIIRRDPDFHDDVERLATALRDSVSSGVLDLTKVSDERSASQVQSVREPSGAGARLADFLLFCGKLILVVLLGPIALFVMKRHALFALTVVAYLAFACTLGLSLYNNYGSFGAAPWSAYLIWWALLGNLSGATLFLITGWFPGKFRRDFVRSFRRAE